jgi:hypothetical protein
MLEEIVAELERSEGSISHVKIREWMSTTDLDAMGAVYALLSEPAHSARISPPIDKYEVSAFLRRYFDRCITENPESEWSDSRYSAGWDLAHWLRHWAKSKDLDLVELDRWTRWLGELYRKGDEAIRLAIETATLEHVLGEPAVRELFADWLKDPVLAEGYRRSLDGPGALPAARSSE